MTENLATSLTKLRNFIKIQNRLVNTLFKKINNMNTLNASLKSNKIKVSISNLNKTQMVP